MRTTGTRPSTLWPIAPLTAAEADAVFSGDFAFARAHFEALAAEGERAITAQDRAIYALCRPERLLDLIRRFTVFDGGVRKIARHQQFFGIRKAVERVRQFSLDGRRKGGVIWHTQGSGKSLTMVMLGRALALDKAIPNPRILIVTDRDDLDKQIKDTFKSCELEPVRATSGAHLIELIRNRTPLVTTIINKFDTAAKAAEDVDEDANIFVLVDESHRTQTGRYGGHSQFATRDAPASAEGLLSRLHRHAAAEEGEEHALDLRRPDPQLRDRRGRRRRRRRAAALRGAAGRAAGQWRRHRQLVREDQRRPDGQQKADLKRKYLPHGRAVQDRPGDPGQGLRHLRALPPALAGHRLQGAARGAVQGGGGPLQGGARRDRPRHQRDRHLSADDNEGNEEVDKESKDLVRGFWAQMMARYKTEDEYNRQIIDAFKGSGDPEILIVVSKLLTGFDAPRNTVLYVCKSLREHNLLQAIARVNRLYEDERDREAVRLHHRLRGPARASWTGADDLQRLRGLRRRRSRRHGP